MILPSDFLFIGDDLTSVTDKWCVKIKYDVNEEDYIHDRINHQKNYWFFLNIIILWWSEILNVLIF